MNRFFSRPGINNPEQDLLAQKYRLLHGMEDRLEKSSDAEGLAQVRRDLNSVHYKMGLDIFSVRVRVISDTDLLSALHAAIHLEMHDAARQGNVARFQTLMGIHSQVVNQLSNSRHDRSSPDYSASFRR